MQNMLNRVLTYAGSRFGLGQLWVLLGWKHGSFILGNGLSFALSTDVVKCRLFH